jgi:hypothetical protein
MITVASLWQIIDYLGSLNLSRELAPICAKSFIIRFYLILLNNKILFDVTDLNFTL